jgi:DNA-binding NtrC family response regulator
VRDRAVEQLDKHEAKVIIYGTDGTAISRREAAFILKVQPQSLRRRLRQYRQQGRVTLVELMQTARRL